MVNFLIDHVDKVKDKQDLLQKLQGIQIASQLTRDIVKVVRPVSALMPNPLDQQYAQIKCKMETIKPSESDYNMIERFI